MSIDQLKMLLPLLLSWVMYYGIGCNHSADQTDESKIAIPRTEFSLLNRMQGHWQDSQLEEASIEIVGKRMLWVFQEEVMAEKSIEVFKSYPKVCTGEPRPNGAGFFVAYNETEGFCYQILSMQDDVFDYYPIGPVQN